MDRLVHVSPSVVNGRLLFSGGHCHPGTVKVTCQQFLHQLSLLAVLQHTLHISIVLCEGAAEADRCRFCTGRACSTHEYSHSCSTRPASVAGPRKGCEQQWHTCGCFGGREPSMQQVRGSNGWVVHCRTVTCLRLPITHIPLSATNLLQCL